VKKTTDVEIVEKPITVAFQESIKLMTFVLISLLAFRGLIDFFEGKRSSFIDSVVTFFTEPFVRPFYDVFPPDSAAVNLAVFSAILFVCILAAFLYILASSIHRLERIRLKRLHIAVTVGSLKQKRHA
jgi:hypothetical protein